MNTAFNEYAHKRYNSLTGEWVLVSPHRTKRPWQGQQEAPIVQERPSYDATCYLCPGNERAGGEQTPVYEQTYVFENDFAALQKGIEPFEMQDGLLIAKSEQGICKVLCFSPDHSKTLADLDLDAIKAVIQTWQQEFKTLSELPQINYIQLFENKGAMMGCSNPHPHGQIWAQESLPNEVQKKDVQQKKYYEKDQESLLTAYLRQEESAEERIIYSNAHFVVLVPFWAVWPYETMIVPKRQQATILEMTTEEQQAFAEALQQLTQAYDKVFDCSFPYSSGIHQAPVNGSSQEHWHWHMCFYPPLLRSATVKKFMVGYEMFGMPQRDITAEMAAEKIRICLK